MDHDPRPASAPELVALAGVRSRLAQELGAYLERLRAATASRARHLPEDVWRHRGDGLGGLTQTLRVVERRSGAHGYRRRAVVNREQEPETLDWDAAARSRFPRVILIGDSGFGKTWHLRTEAHHAATEALAGLAVGKGAEELELPFLVRLDALERRLGEGGLGRDTRFVEALLEVAEGLRGARAPGPLRRTLVEALSDGARCRAVVLFDGWDGTAARHDPRFKDELRGFVESLSPRSRVVLASRSIGYDRGPGFSLGGEADAGRPGVPFSELDLVPLDAERIERFAAAWFGSRDEALPFLIEIGVRDAQRQLVKNPRGDLYDLARIPLLLTLLARLAQESGELPHRRSTVYYRWLQKYFGEWVTDRPRRIPEAAIPAMLTLVGQASVDLLRRDDASKPPGAFEREDLRAALELHLPEPSSKSELSGVRASTVVDILAADGLLVADTPDESDVRFLHLSIQEYLAASSLAGPRLTTDVEGAVKAASEGLFVRSGRDVESELACSPTGDNVLRFLSGVHVDLGGEGTGGTRRLGAYVEVLLERAREHERQGRIYGLAARASCDWPQEARSTGSSLFERVRKELLHAFDARGASWPLADRLFALEALDSIGDPRLDEDDLWVEIRGGKVSLGDPKHFKAAPPHTAKVKPFCISFRPIVVADFEPFVEKGYAVERYWTCGRTEYDGSAPYDWDTQLRGPHNAPVTGVSWYAANAYCAWVSERWGYEVTLPTETQWECVARGKDGRSYPWGNEPPEFGDRARANHDFEGSPGRPTSIGAFPLGTSRAWSRPIVDLGGNVWEWCRDLWRGRDDDSWGQKPREAPENHRHRRVIRGGSWYYDDTFVHASSRYWNEPGNRLRSVGFRVVHPGASIRRSSGRRTWGR